MLARCHLFLPYIAIVVTFLLSGCMEQTREIAVLHDETTARTQVPVTDGKILLQGFIAGGSFATRQSEAIQSASQACSDIRTKLLQTFDRFLTHSFKRCGREFISSEWQKLQRHGLWTTA